MIIQAPPSKSLSHRGLIAAALTRGESVVSNVLQSDDIQRTRDCLTALGADIAAEGSTCRVQGALPLSGGGSGDEPVWLNVGESGTTCRLITPVAAALGRRCRIFGEGRMHERPIGELSRALEQLGVSFIWEGKAGYPPFILESSGLSGGSAEISLEESSQYLSGLLLAAPLAEAGVSLGISGRKAVSWPYVGLTLQTMQAFGVEPRMEVRRGSGWQEVSWEEVHVLRPGEVRFHVEPASYAPQSFWVEGDWSNASYFRAAGALLPQGLTVGGLGRHSVQGDRMMADILRTMGAAIDWERSGLSVRPGKLNGAELDMGFCPDIVPTVAVLASLAEGPTRITNVAHLRIKESDRLGGVAKEIEKAGAKTSVFEDGLEISPKQRPLPDSLAFCTYGDHRMAMSLSLFELAGCAVELDDPKCVAKSFPGFFQSWEAVRRLAKAAENGPIGRV
jgi:3-phosphoshikimate 1-carboxyvinyltransferase